MNWLPPSDLPSSVLDPATLYCAFARDRTDGTHTAPSFADAAWLHGLFDALGTSAASGARIILS